jgi:hypothetical protein
VRFAIGHVTKTTGVRQDVAQRDGAGRFDPLALLAHHHLGELREMLRQRIVKAEFAVVRQDRDAHGRNRLAHGCDPEDVVGAHLALAVHLRRAGCADMENPILAGDQGHDAGRLALIDKLLHSRRDPGKAVRLLRE